MRGTQMARKNVLLSFPILNAVDISQSQVSDPTGVGYTDNIGMLIDWAGSSPAGTITVEVCDDDTKGKPSGVWHTLTLSGTPAVSGNIGQHEISINQLPYSWVRVRYTRTSGSGSLTVKISTKQIGG